MDNNKEKDDSLFCIYPCMSSTGYVRPLKGRIKTKQRGSSNMEESEELANSTDNVDNTYDEAEQKNVHPWTYLN